MSHRILYGGPVYETLIRIAYVQNPSLNTHVGLCDFIFGRVFTYIHTFRMRTSNDLARLCVCVASSEPLLLANAISTKVARTGSYIGFQKLFANRDGSRHF